MRIALCICGLATGNNDFGRPVDYKYAERYYKEFFLKRYNVDVFIHSWSKSVKKEIEEIYAPKRAIFEEPIIFAKDLTDPNVPHNKEHSNKSRFYSAKNVIALKRQHETAHNFEYDIVFVSRFDVCFFNDFGFEKVDNSKFYTAEFGDGNNVLDLWFFSNSKMMDYYATIYDHLDLYAKEVGIWCPHRMIPLHFKKIGIQRKDFAGMKLMNKDFALTRSIFDPAFDEIIDRKNLIK